MEVLVVFLQYDDIALVYQGKQNDFFLIFNKQQFFESRKSGHLLCKTYL